MLLRLADRRLFTTGTAAFYYPPGVDELSKERITIAVQIGGMITTAIVDTGETYMVLSPELAEVIPLGPIDEAGPTEIQFQGKVIKGSLRRVAVTFLNSAEDGKPLPLGVLAFVPDNAGEQGEYMPSFLGLTSCLDVMCIGIDGSRQEFHFG